MPSPSASWTIRPARAESAARSASRNSPAVGSLGIRNIVTWMYVSVSRLRVQEGREDDLVARFRDRLGLVDDFDGFVDLQVWQSDRDVGEMLMVSRWRDRASFTAYMKSA